MNQPLIFSPFGHLARRIARLKLSLIFITLAICTCGIVLLYAAGGGNFHPYAARQFTHLGVALSAMLVIALLDIKTVYKLSYVAFVATLIMLALVPFIGQKGMGAQRWIDLGPFAVQPSEFAKLTLILALARYFHAHTLKAVHSFMGLFALALLIALPAALTLVQPDLGTAIIILAVGIGMAFSGGLSKKIFWLGGLAAIAATPVWWEFFARDYQKERVLTFLNPERDPLGAGYHIIQSKIALGSAGFWGKGFLQGTQSQLEFLPEKHTDFIFTLLTEDFGLFGALCLIFGYMMLILSCLLTANRCESSFPALCAGGVAGLIFLHAIINISMITGLMPVVGVPLPLVSYGGTSLLTMLAGVGLVLNMHIHRDTHIPGASGLTR